MKNLSTSKKLIIFLFGSCIFIELFVMAVTVANLFLAYQNGTPIDFSPLITLIGAVVGEVIAYAVYSLKALKENSVGGIVYEQAINKKAEVSQNDVG